MHNIGPDLIRPSSKTGWLRCMFALPNVGAHHRYLTLICFFVSKLWNADENLAEPASIQYVANARRQVRGKRWPARCLRGLRKFLVVRCNGCTGYNFFFDKNTSKPLYLLNQIFAYRSVCTIVLLIIKPTKQDVT
jgi:hypothetical protein